MSWTALVLSTQSAEQMLTMHVSAKHGYVANVISTDTTEKCLAVTFSTPGSVGINAAEKVPTSQQKHLILSTQTFVKVQMTDLTTNMTGLGISCFGSGCLVSSLQTQLEISW